MFGAADGTGEEMVEFLERRLYQLLSDANAAPTEAIRAVQGARGGDPHLVASSLAVLAPKLADGSLTELLEAYVRCVRITSKNADAADAALAGATGAAALSSIDTDLFDDSANPSERALHVRSRRAPRR